MATVMTLPFLVVSVAQADDPWQDLHSFSGPSGRLVVIEAGEASRYQSSPGPHFFDDPWAGLSNWSTPFSEQDEVAAIRRPAARIKVSRALHSRLSHYRGLIAEASARFDIPPEVIGALIMVESSGDPWASAATSSAKGLMQTINATFAEARQGLRGEGVVIRNDPFDPRASILAGCWYLDRMYRQAEADFGWRRDRRQLASWRQAAEYYYAGPEHGRKRAGVVILYAGGRPVTVDKAGYARKVMNWARLMG